MKKLLAAGLAALGSVALAGQLNRRRSKRPEVPERQPSPEPMFRYVTAFILPVWTAAGLADYFWHRQTNIARTSGIQESTTHLLMMIEGAPICAAGLFLEINAGALALMAACGAAHEATVLWDIRYTSDKRVIPSGEQHTHSFLEVLPFCVLTFAAATHWDQFISLFGRGDQPADFKLRFKRPPMPVPALLALLASMGIFSGLPHCEELWRCWVAESRGEKGIATPAGLPEIMHSVV